MSIAYGAVALIISLLVSNFFARQKTLPDVKLFIFAFSSEFLFIGLLGFTFYILDLGFFAKLSNFNDVVMRIFGFALFLAILVAMKAVNQRRQNHVDES